MCSIVHLMLLAMHKRGLCILCRQAILQKSQSEIDPQSGVQICHWRLISDINPGSIH
jgi:hypothetical protein